MTQIRACAGRARVESFAHAGFALVVDDDPRVLDLVATMLENSGVAFAGVFALLRRMFMRSAENVISPPTRWRATPLAFPDRAILRLRPTNNVRSARAGPRDIPEFRRSFQRSRIAIVPPSRPLPRPREL